MNYRLIIRPEAELDLEDAFDGTSHKIVVWVPNLYELSARADASRTTLVYRQLGVILLPTGSSTNKLDAP